MPFGISDGELAAGSAGVFTREELFNRCELAIIAKPVPKDLLEMREESILWGWPHCVQQHDMTQMAIDRKLTLIAWEEMHYWTKEGAWNGHVFHKNNEIAGYAGVQHALNLRGKDGNFGEKLKAVVISYGSVSQGSVKGLMARGIEDISVYTAPEFIIKGEKRKGVKYGHFYNGENGRLMGQSENSPGSPFIEILQEADIIINGVLQDTDAPLMFVNEEETSLLKKGSLIIDISCDEGMGFSFAIPTSFNKPILQFDQVYYYAVDHTPSYLWNASTWEISKALIPFLKTVMSGPEEWDQNTSIQKAIEIQNGTILNPKILRFQNRSKEYPHFIER
jgi:alanine dehydrogenase